MRDSPAANCFAHAFRRPIQRWLDNLRQATWREVPAPARPRTREEWASVAMVPPVPPDDPDCVMRP
eukprot:4905905-Pyramimonas_sp.AAC.1